mmetsp:Transcript_100728/g.285494  ORF Transcript_100728/g.285494 Transcript_100728/m.285494 type:complete len:268 (+) Transcript_100728:1099-1902(+)
MLCQLDRLQAEPMLRGRRERVLREEPHVGQLPEKLHAQCNLVMQGIVVVGTRRKDRHKFDFGAGRADAVAVCRGPGHGEQRRPAGRSRGPERRRGARPGAGGGGLRRSGGGVPGEVRRRPAGEGRRPEQEPASSVHDGNGKLPGVAVLPGPEDAVLPEARRLGRLPVRLRARRPPVGPAPVADQLDLRRAGAAGARGRRRGAGGEAAPRWTSQGAISKEAAGTRVFGCGRGLPREPVLPGPGQAVLREAPVVRRVSEHVCSRPEQLG